MAASGGAGAAAPAGEGRTRLRDIIARRSFATGDFTLASGRKSNLYFNLKPTMFDAEGAYLIARAVLDLARSLGAEFIGGLEMGAVPVTGALAALSHLDGQPVGTFFVRKKPKDHGAKLLVEGLAPGESLAGKTVVVVEDVTTTGQSAMKAVEAVRDAGGRVDAIVTVLDRQEGAEAFLRGEGISLHAVFRAADFLGG